MKKNTKKELMSCNPNNSVKDFFKYLGYQDEDIIGICFGIGQPNDPGIMKPIVFTSVKDLTSQDYYGDLANIENSKKFKKGIFYACATYKTKTDRKKENVKEARELVIDIDYGSDGHKKTSTFENKENALSFVKDKLPVPTIVVSTGGGLHVHYRLKEAIPVERYEELAKTLANHFEGIDNTGDCGHLFRIPNTLNTKKGNFKHVEISEFNDVEYSYEDFFNIIPNLDKAMSKKKILNRKVYCKKEDVL